MAPMTMPTSAPVPTLDFPLEPDWPLGDDPRPPPFDGEDVEEDAVIEETRDPDVGLSDPEAGVAVVRMPEVPEEALDSEEPPPVEPPPVDALAVGDPVGMWPAKNEMLSPVLFGSAA